MLKQEIEQYFSSYPLQCISFYEVDVIEETKYSLLNIDLYFVYKTRHIHITFFLNKIVGFNIRTSIPTKNKKVVAEVDKLLEDFLFFLQEESCYRMVLAYADQRPKIHKNAYNYFVCEILDRIDRFFPYSLYALLIFMSILFTYSGFKISIFMGIISFVCSLCSALILHSGIQFSMSDDCRTAERSKIKIICGMSGIFFCLFLSVVIKVIKFLSKSDF